MANTPAEQSLGLIIHCQTQNDYITEDQVKAALRADKGSNVQLLSWIVKEFTQKGDNYGCLIFSITVSYLEGSSVKEITYIAKCNPRWPTPDLKKRFRNLFEKEAGFFEHLVPLLNAKLVSVGEESLRTPTCFFINMVEDEEVIIFNDLRRRGFKMVDRKMGLDAAHTLLVLREIGRLHAVSVLVQSKLRESLNDKYNFLIKELKDSEYFFIFMETATLRMSYIMEKIGGCQNLVTWARDFAPKCSNAYWELTRRSDPFDVLCHGDCWLNNFLFRYNECGAPVDVILLDFQQCCLTSPGIDLNFFMYSSFDGAYRRDNLPTFLKAYYESFSSVLEAGGSALPYSSEELLLEYRRKNLFGFLTGLYVVPLAMCVDENVTDLSEVMDGGLEAFRKEKNERFIRQLENNPLLKTRLISLFDDLIEHGLIQ